MFSLFAKKMYVGYVYTWTDWVDEGDQRTGKVTHHLWKLFEDKNGNRKAELEVSGDRSDKISLNYETYSRVTQEAKLEVSAWVSGGPEPRNFKDKDVPIRQEKPKNKKADIIPFSVVKGGKNEN